MSKDSPKISDIYRFDSIHNKGFKNIKTFKYDGLLLNDRFQIFKE